MVRVANPHKLYTYRHKSFDKGEEWVFRATKGDGDDEDIESLTRNYVVQNLDDAEVKAADDAGKDVKEVIAKYIVPEIKMSGMRAALLHMSHHWTLKYPADYTTAEIGEDGNQVLDKNGHPKLVPHEMAGKDMPLTAESIALLEGVQKDAYWTMSPIWAADGRTEKQEAEFPRGVLRMDENRSRQSSQERRTKTPATRRVPKTKAGSHSETLGEAAPLDS